MTTTACTDVRISTGYCRGREFDDATPAVSSRCRWCCHLLAPAWRAVAGGLGEDLPELADAWADEAECLMPVGRPFDGFVEYGKRVRSEERRVGKGCVSTGSYRWWLYH